MAPVGVLAAGEPDRAGGGAAGTGGSGNTGVAGAVRIGAVAPAPGVSLCVAGCICIAGCIARQYRMNCLKFTPASHGFGGHPSILLHCAEKPMVAEPSLFGVFVIT